MLSGIAFLDSSAMVPEENPDLFEPGIGDLAEPMRIGANAPDEVWSSRFDELLGRAAILEESEVLSFAKAGRAVYEMHMKRNE